MAPEFDYAGNPIIDMSGNSDTTDETVDTSTVDAEAASEAEAAEETGAAEDAESIDAAEDDEPDEGDPSEEEDGEDDAGADKRPKQSKKENARFAAERRKAELREAVEKARREEQEKARSAMDAMVAGMNLKNPYTGAAVTTKAEFDAWQQRTRQEQRAAVQEKTGMDDEQMQAFIRGLPEVQEAEAEKAKAEALLEQARQERARSAVESELQKIHALEPAIGSLDDLEKLPEHDAILDMVKRGYALSDAWKLTHYEAVQSKKAEAARESAARSAAGKDHLAPTRARGKGSVSVPKETMAYYKAMFPNKSEAEIIRAYNKYAQSKK